MKISKTKTNTAPYEKDFYSWTVDQAMLLRSGKLSEIDVINVAEEIESLGRRDRREMVERLENLIAELLKWQFDPGARCGYWASNIAQQRFELENIIGDSPSLRAHAIERLGRVYSKARERLVRELNLLQPGFPSECPFTIEQILSEDFLPKD